MSLSRRVARPLLSAVFVVEGIDTLRDPGPRVKASQDVAPPLADKLGLPSDPELLVKLNAGAQVTAGLLMAVGKFRRLSALVLIGSTIPTTYAGHRFWELDDPQERGQQRAHFLKNLGLIGALVLELVDTEGAPSLGWRVRRAAKHSGAAISVGSHAGSAKTTQLSKRANAKAAKTAAAAAAAARAGLDTGGHVLAIADDRSRGARKAARKAAQEAAKEATKNALKAAKNAQKAAKNVKQLAAAPTDRAADLWSAGSGRASDLLDTGGRRAGAVLGAGSERAGQLLGSRSDWAGQLLGAGSDRAGQAVSAGSDRAGQVLAAGSHRAEHLLGSGSERAGDLVAAGAKLVEEAWHGAADRLPGS